MGDAAGALPLLTPYKMGRFELSHRSAFCSRSIYPFSWYGNPNQLQESITQVFCFGESTNRGTNWVRKLPSNYSFFSNSQRKISTGHGPQKKERNKKKLDEQAVAPAEDCFVIFIFVWMINSTPAFYYQILLHCCLRLILPSRADFDSLF